MSDWPHVEHTRKGSALMVGLALATLVVVCLWSLGCLRVIVSPSTREYGVFLGSTMSEPIAVIGSDVNIAGVRIGPFRLFYDKFSGEIAY